MNKLIIGLLVVCLVGVVGVGLYAHGLSLVPVNVGAGFTDEYNVKVFHNTVTLGSSGTAINQYKCYTNSSYNPGAVASTSAPDSLAFLTPSATVGDVMIASLASVTSTDLWTVEAKVTAGSGTAGATTTLYLRPGMLGGVNLTTTTAKVCITN